MGNRTRAEPRRGRQGAGVATGRVCSRRRAAALRRPMTVDHRRGHRHYARLGLTPRVVWPRVMDRRAVGRGRETEQQRRQHVKRRDRLPSHLGSRARPHGLECCMGAYFSSRTRWARRPATAALETTSDTMTTPTDVGIEPPGESAKSGNCGLCRLDGARAPVAWLDKAWSRGAPSRRIAPAPRRAP